MGSNRLLKQLYCQRNFQSISRKQAKGLFISKGGQILQCPFLIWSWKITEEKKNILEWRDKDPNQTPTLESKQRLFRIVFMSVQREFRNPCQKMRPRQGNTRKCTLDRHPILSLWSHRFAFMGFLDYMEPIQIIQDLFFLRLLILITFAKLLPTCNKTCLYFLDFRAEI